MGNSDWGYFALGELTDNLDSVRVPVKESERKKGQYPYYGASGVIDMVDGYLFNGEYLLVAEDGENLRSRKTPIAFMAKGKFWVNNHAHIVQGNSKSDTRFLMYALHSTDISGYLTGSTIPKLTQDNLNRIPIYAPTLPEQRAIVGILGALDDKIEVNRRMNATLEGMARAVFREMTSDVEEQGSILEFADLLGGGTPKTSEPSYWDGDIEWVSAKDVGNVEGIFLLNTEKKITQDGVDNSSTKLLPEKTTIVTARGTVGAHCILGKPMTMNQSNYGLKAKKGIGDYFVYFTLSEMIGQLKQQSYGTIFDTITTKIFQNVQCAQPTHEVIQKIEDQITPMMEAILNNQKESRTLASLRDSLLPRLMRGEVRVKE